MEIARNTGYTRPYVSTMLKRLEGAAQMLDGMSRGWRPQGSLRPLSAKKDASSAVGQGLSAVPPCWRRIGRRQLFNQVEHSGGDPVLELRAAPFGDPPIVVETTDHEGCKIIAASRMSRPLRP